MRGVRTLSLFALPILLAGLPRAAAAQVSVRDAEPARAIGGAAVEAPVSEASGAGSDAEVRGFAPWLVRDMDRVVGGAIARGATPGAAVVVGYGGEVVLTRTWGREDWAEDAPPVTDGTVWDLASVTKVVATTLAVMILEEEGRLDLDAPLSAYLPAWPADGAAGRVTVRNLLDHTSGLPAGAPVARLGPDRDARVRALAREVEAEPGSRELYSDLGPILAGFAVEAVTGETLDAFVAERVYRPLGLADTGFRPLEAGVPPSRIAPTERLGEHLLRGVVHDPTARALGGVAGNAGVFSSATDLATLASALLWERPHRLVCRDVLEAFTGRPGPDTRFGTGWEMPARWAVWSEMFSEEAFGHTGFTGTSLWIDPVQDMFVVLLTSRVNPTAENDLHLELRRRLHDLVGRADLHLEVAEREADWRLPRVWRGVDSCRAEAGFQALAGVPRWVFTLR